MGFVQFIAVSIYYKKKNVEKKQQLLLLHRCQQVICYWINEHKLAKNDVLDKKCCKKTGKMSYSMQWSWQRKPNKFSLSDEKKMPLFFHVEALHFLFS